MVKCGKCYQINQNTLSNDSYPVTISKLKGVKKFSVSLWVRIDSATSTFNNILALKMYRPDNNTERWLRLESVTLDAGKFRGIWYDNGSFTDNGGLGVSSNSNLGTWVHYTYIFDGSRCLTYINGNYHTARNYGYEHSKNMYLTGEFVLGGHYMINTAATNYAVGGVNNIKIYNHVLSKEEIYQDYMTPMLHYSFQDPYVTEVENLQSEVVPNYVKSSGSDDKGNYIIKSSTNNAWGGIMLKSTNVVGGECYTWSLEVNPTTDLIIDTNSYIVSSSPLSSKNIWFDGNSQSLWTIAKNFNDIGHEIIASYRGNIPRNKWTRVWITVKVKPEFGKGTLGHNFCPVTKGDDIKIYYRNSMLEKSHSPHPYTKIKRNQGLIRDNSGMGNDGTIVYNRVELPITWYATPTADNTTLVGNNGTYTWNNFKGTNNQCCILGKIPYNSWYHYKNAVQTIEFDITLNNITVASGKSFSIKEQGIVVLKNGTGGWSSVDYGPNPYHWGDTCIFTDNLGNLANGTYHIVLQTYAGLDINTNTDYFEFGFRVNYINGGTITLTNFKSYYQNADTSKLDITERWSNVGNRSCYFNGKSYIDCGKFLPSTLDEVTISCWAYHYDWSKSSIDYPLGQQTIVGSNRHTVSNDVGGFGLKFEHGNNVLNFPIYQGTGWSPECNVDCSNFSSGWHLFTGVADKNRKALYADGKLVNEVIHNLNTPIKNASSVTNGTFYIASERNYYTLDASINNNWNLKDMQLDDVRLYPIALTEKEVKNLYDTKMRIDKEGNIFTSQLIETPKENIAVINESSQIATFACGATGAYDKTTNIYTFTITTVNSGNQWGPYFHSSCFKETPITGKHYKYSCWVKLPVTGDWYIKHERAGNVPRKKFIAGKWYYIENDFIANNNNYLAFIFYSYTLLKSGDKIQVRDLEMWRIDDDLLDSEKTNQSITKKEELECFDLKEFNIDKFTELPCIEKYGAKWYRVFHHNTNGDTVWFTDADEALYCTEQHKFSRLNTLENYRCSDGKFEFLLEYPIEHPNKYNRWKQTDNPVNVQEVIGTMQAGGYTPIHIDFTTNGWGRIIKKYKI